MDVRAATAADIPRLVAMKAAMFAEAGRGHLLPPSFADTVRSDYEGLYRDGLALHFVAVDGQAITACVGAFLKNDLPYRYFVPAHYGFIGDVYTESPYRRRGLAVSLSRRAIAWLEGKGVRTVRLLASEAGRPIYEALGFKPTDEMALDLPSQ